MAGGGSIGVLLGGVLTGALNWHWIFLVNLPIGVAVFVLSLRLLPDGARRHSPSAGSTSAGAITVTLALDARRLRDRQRQRRPAGRLGQTLGLLACVGRAAGVLLLARVAA